MRVVLSAGLLSWLVGEQEYAGGRGCASGEVQGYRLRELVEEPFPLPRSSGCRRSGTRREDLRTVAQGERRFRPASRRSPDRPMVWCERCPVSWVKRQDIGPRTVAPAPLRLDADTRSGVTLDHD